MPLFSLSQSGVVSDHVDLRMQLVLVLQIALPRRQNESRLSLLERTGGGRLLKRFEAYLYRDRATFGPSILLAIEAAYLRQKWLKWD